MDIPLNFQTQLKGQEAQATQPSCECCWGESFLELCCHLGKRATTTPRNSQDDRVTTKYERITIARRIRAFVSRAVRTFARGLQNGSADKTSSNENLSLNYLKSRKY